MKPETLGSTRKYIYLVFSLISIRMYIRLASLGECQFVEEISTPLE
jgi:hypothetical protein